MKAYGIDVNNDVYIDKPGRQRPAAQRSLENGYTTMAGEIAGREESFGNIKKSQVNKNNRKL